MNSEKKINPQDTKCEETKTHCVTNVCCCCGHDHHDECHKNEVKCGYSVQKNIETCTFDIYMTRVRTFENKDGKAELMITGYANGQSGVFPGMGSWFVTSESWVWTNINKRIASITIEKGTKRIVRVDADAIECRGGIGEGTWELGSGSGEPTAPEKSLTLESGMPTSPAWVEVHIHKPTVAGGITCKVAIEFEAFQVTP
jgi:hypothetical protein